MSTEQWKIVNDVTEKLFQRKAENHIGISSNGEKPPSAVLTSRKQKIVTKLISTLKLAICSFKIIHGSFLKQIHHKLNRFPTVRLVAGILLKPMFRYCQVCHTISSAKLKQNQTFSSHILCLFFYKIFVFVSQQTFLSIS